MNPEEYLENLEKRRKWYSNKSGTNKNNYQISSVIKIVLIGLVPVVSLNELNYWFYPYLVPLLSFGTIITEGIQSIYQFKDNWINYRNTSEKLKREISLFKTNSGVYKTTPEQTSYNLFVETCEAIMCEENLTWVDNTSNIEITS